MPTTPSDVTTKVIDSTGKVSFALDSLPVAWTYDGSGNVLTATYGPDANGKVVRRTNVWAGTQLTSQSAFQLVATDLTLSALAAGGQPGVASKAFSVGVSPLGAIVDGTIVVTPSDSGGGGTFNPTSLSLTAANPAGTFTYTPGSAGTKAISITSNSALANPLALAYLAAGAYPGAPTIGALTPMSGAISVAFTAPTDTGGSTVGIFEVKLTTGEFATGTTSPITVPTTSTRPVRAVVRAANTLGYGNPSAPSAYATPIQVTIPGTMAAPVLTAAANAVLVAFTAPSDGGSAILDYDYLDINGVHTTLTASGQSVPAAAGVLTAGAIRARNVSGYSAAYSPQSNSVTPMVAQVLRVVSTQNRVNTLSSTGTTAGYTKQCVRWRHMIGSGDVAGIVMSANGWRLGAAGVSNNPNDYTVEQIALEPAGGTPVLFSVGGVQGAPMVVAAGAVDVQTDMLLPSAFGLSAFPVGAAYYVKAIVSVASNTSGVPYPTRAVGDAPNSTQQVNWFDPTATTLSSITTAGKFTATAGTALGTSRTQGFCPIMLGKFANGDPATYFGGGSSSVEGVGTYGTSETGAGLFQFSMVDDITTNANPKASLNFAIGSTTSAVHNATATKTLLAAYLKYARRAFFIGSGNDIPGTAIGTTTANLAAIKAHYLASGIEKVGFGLIQPRSDAYSVWQAGGPATQTTTSGYELGGLVDQHNDFIKTLGNWVDTPGMRFGTDPATVEFHQWADAKTSDGVHRTQAASIEGAANLRALYATL